MRYMLLWVAMFLVGGIAAIAAPEDDEFDPAPPPDPNQFSIVKVSSDPAEATSQLRGAGQYQVGQSITVSATANTNYVFQYWTHNGDRIDKGTSFSYTVTTEQATFVAHYLYQDPTVKVEKAVYLEADPADGATFNRTNGQLAEVGRSVTCTANLATSFTFLGWYEGETLVSSSRSYTFTMPDQEVHLTARLDYDPVAPVDPLAKYFVSVLADPQGAAVLSGAGQYVEGSRVYISASANANYTFVNWTLDGVEYSTDRAFYYTVGNTPASFVAHFTYQEPEPETPVQTPRLYLKADPVDGGTINRASGEEVTAGSSVTCTATTKQNFTFLGWYQGETLVSSSRSYTFIMPDEDLTLTAMFDYDPADPIEPTLTYYTLNYKIDGTIVHTESLAYADAIVPYEPEERAGYTFSGWQNLPASMPSNNVTVTGTYIKNEELMYEVNSASAGHGTVLRSTEETRLLMGTLLTLTAQADEHYHFDHWSDDSKENPHAITVSKDETLTAYFALNTHYVIYKISGVEVYREEVAYGATITPYEASSIEDYAFSGWKGMPEDMTMPDADVTVTGSYVYIEVSYEVNSVSDGHGTVSRSHEDITLVAGTQLTLTATADEHYHFDHWSDNSTENPHTIMVSRNNTYTAYFALNTHDVIYSIEGAEVYRETLAYGAAIVAYTPGEREGYTFAGWAGLPASMKMPDADVVVTGSYKEDAIEVVDGAVLAFDAVQQHVNLNYKRNFKNSNWQALYVPFAIPFETLAENGLEVAELNDTHMYDRDDDGVFEEVTLEFLKLKSGSTEPNYPYIIRANEVGLKTLALSDVDLEKSEALSYECSTLKQTFTITGTYTGVDGQTMFDNNYYAMGGGVLGRVSSAGVALSSQRWYVSIANKNGSPVDYYAPSMRISVDGIMAEETGIDAISAKPEQNGTMSDLLGRRVKDVQTPGLYIRNGVKVMLK